MSRHTATKPTLTAGFQLGLALNSRGRGAVFLGLLWWLLFAIGCAATVGYYTGSQMREFARSPQVAETGQEVNFSFKWVPSWGDQVHGYLLNPHTESAPFPPGMSQWLAPGEAAVSAALAEQYPIGQAGPWGTVTAIIPTEAVSNPRELFFYARPTGPLPADWGDPAVDFATPSIPINGDLLNTLPLPYTLLFLVFFLAFVAVILVGSGLYQVTSVRSTSALLKDLGAGTRQRFSLGLGAMVWPLLASFATAIPTIFACAHTNIPLPLVNTELVSTDFASQLPLAALIFIIGWAITAAGSGLSALTAPPKTSKRIWEQVLSRLGQALVIPTIGFVVAFVMLDQLRGLPLQIVFFGSVLSLAFTIPTIAIWISEAAAALIDRIKPTAATTLASRKLQAHSSGLIKAMVVVSLPLTTLGATQLYSLQLSAPMQAAMYANQVVGNSILRVDVRGSAVETAAALRAGLRDVGATIMATAPEGIEGDVQASFDQEAWGVLGINPGSTEIQAQTAQNQRAAALFTAMGSTIEPVESLANSANVDSIYLVANHDLDVTSVSARATAGGGVVHPLGAGWLSAAKLMASRVNWFTLFGTPAALSVILAALAVLHRDLNRRLGLRDFHSTYHAPPHTLAAVTTITTFLPAILTTALSYAGYLALAQGFALHQGGGEGATNTPVGFQIALVTVGTVVSIVLAARTLRSANHDE